MGTKLSIMVVKGIGKVRRFQISSGLLILSTLFFVLYTVASIFAINGYFEKRREAQSLKKQISLTKDAAMDSRSELLRLQQRLAVLEDYISLAKNPAGKSRHAKDPEPPKEAIKADVPNPESEKQPELTNPPTDTQEGLQAKNIASDPEASQAKEEPAARGVAIKDFSVNFENTRMTVSFKLVNSSPGQGPLKGYLHMITLDRNADPPVIRSFPHETLEKGIPVSFKRGQLFHIKNFRAIRGKFFLSGTKQPPATLRIFIYDQTGLMLMEKGFDLNKTG